MSKNNLVKSIPLSKSKLKSSSSVALVLMLFLGGFLSACQDASVEAPLPMGSQSAAPADPDSFGKTAPSEMPLIPSLSPENREKVDNASGVAKKAATRSGCITFVSTTSLRYLQRDEKGKAETLNTARSTLGAQSAAYLALVKTVNDKELASAFLNNGYIGAFTTSSVKAQQNCPK